jgi:hypothetical protein
MIAVTKEDVPALAAKARNSSVRPYMIENSGGCWGSLFLNSLFGEEHRRLPHGVYIVGLGF